MKRIGEPVQSINIFTDEAIGLLLKVPDMRAWTDKDAQMFFGRLSYLTTWIEEKNPVVLFPIAQQIFIWKSKFCVIAYNALQDKVNTPSRAQMFMARVLPIPQDDLVPEAIAWISFINHEDKGLFRIQKQEVAEFDSLEDITRIHQIVADFFRIFENL
jgi:hypothetical protein